MCFHSRQSKEAQALEKRFRAKVLDGARVTSDHFNAFTYPKVPVITDRAPGDIQLYQWGLIPSWAKDTGIQSYTLNAKIETLGEKPSFRGSVGKRCWVLADGFIEWQWLDPKGKKKQPYLITLPDEGAFAFAGLWSTWTDKATGEVLDTYTIVTTEANALMEEIHNSKKRMPVVLTPQNERAWLEGDPVGDFTVCDVALKAVRI